MNADEAALVRHQIEAAEHRAEAAEAERDQYKRERDEARAILARIKSSLAEGFNDPGHDGQPRGIE
jgi:hypothetical protein